MKLLHLLNIIALSATLGACASNVRLDDLPPVDAKLAKTASSNLGPGAGNNHSASTSDSVVEVKNSSDVKLVNLNVAAKGQSLPLTPSAPNPLLGKRSVYFEYDSYAINADFKEILEAHAKNLVANRSNTIVLEGNTDESGGREYNLALGQKRANAVSQALRVLGVNDAQMEAVSFGKEKPKALGTGDAAAAENRRADIAYK